MHQERVKLYKELEQKRGSRLIAYVTGDRPPNLMIQIAQDVIPLFVNHLDIIGETKKISLFLYTRGGDTLAAWSLINLLRSFCNELEIIVPFRCQSAGTLICLGANKIVMTKQASLGPIDPSITTPLNPTVPGYPLPNNKVPVSVEQVNAYFSMAKDDLGIKKQSCLCEVFKDLSQKVHPLVLGSVYKSKNQIRMLAQKLLKYQNFNAEKKEKAISFLCSESGSHDYTIDRREASELGFNIEKPTDGLYLIIKALYDDIERELQLNIPFDEQIYFNEMKKIERAGNVEYNFKRGFVESINGGSDMYITQGDLLLNQNQQLINKIKKGGWNHE